MLTLTTQLLLLLLTSCVLAGDRQLYAEVPSPPPGASSSDRSQSVLTGHNKIYWDEDELAGKIRYMYKEKYPDPKKMAGKVFFNAPFTPPLSRPPSPPHQAADIADSRTEFAHDGVVSAAVDALQQSRARKDKGKAVRNADSSSSLPKVLNKEMSFSQGIPILPDVVEPDSPLHDAATPEHDSRVPDLGQAKDKLAAYVQSGPSRGQTSRWKAPLQRLWKWSKPASKPSTPGVRTPAGTTPEMHTPISAFSPEVPGTPNPKTQMILPYRPWSEKKALRGVKIPESSGINALTDHNSGHWEHWKSMLQVYRKQTFWDRYMERMYWVARNSMQDSTEHRTVVNGAVTGTTSYSKLKFGPVDPRDPPPPHPGKRETLLEERMEVFQRLFYRVPPALTYHSRNVYKENARGYYVYAHDPQILATVHPLHYIQQILTNPRATGILENYNAKDQQTLEDHWMYNRRLDHTISTEDRAVRKVSDTRAVKNMFWPKAWHTDPAFHIKDPLTTPIHEWQVFEPYVRAVRVKI